jgi:hypothetical protein
MSEEVRSDQAVYDRLIAEGKSERIARAKAKAAAVRASKIAEGRHARSEVRPRKRSKALEDVPRANRRWRRCRDQDRSAGRGPTPAVAAG